MFSDELTDKASVMLAQCREQDVRLVTAESCTGGLISALITEIPGSSDVFERGFVTYHNDAKVAMLGVCPDVLKAYGAVSEQVVRQMAEGAIRNSGADMSIAVSGIAGPGGGTADKPVGLVHIASARKNGPTLYKQLNLSGNRGEVRMAVLHESIDLIMEQLFRGRSLG